MATSYTRYTIVVSATLPSDTAPQRLADSLLQYLRGVHDVDEAEARVMRDVVEFAEDADSDVMRVEVGYAQHDDDEKGGQ